MEGKERHESFAFTSLSAVTLARWSFGPAEDDILLPLARGEKSNDECEEREKNEKENEVAIFSSVDSEGLRAPSLFIHPTFFSFSPRPRAAFCSPTSAWTRSGRIASDHARSTRKEDGKRRVGRKERWGAFTFWQSKLSLLWHRHRAGFNDGLPSLRLPAPARSFFLVSLARSRMRTPLLPDGEARRPWPWVWLVDVVVFSSKASESNGSL